MTLLPENALPSGAGGGLFLSRRRRWPFTQAPGRAGDGGGIRAGNPQRERGLFQDQSPSRSF